MSMIISSLSYTHPDRETLFENMNLAVAKGDKAALVGANGAGKSTLLQVIAGQLQPSSGNVSLSGDLWYVPQHLGQYDSLTVAEALGVHQKLKALGAILAGDVLPDHFTDLNDDWEIEEKVRAALASLHLNHLSLSQPLTTMSGGEKTKLFLAGISIHKPGIILLDEPSNHLDASGRDWLYDLIADSKATILAVSHDKALLRLLNITLELYKGGIAQYGGNYDFYQEQKKTETSALQWQVDEKEKTLKKAQQKARDIAEQRQKAALRGKAQGQTGSLPRILAGGRKTQAEQSTAKLQGAHQEKVSAVAADLKEARAALQTFGPLRIDFAIPALHQGKVLIDARAVSFSYGETMLWQPLSFQVRSGERIQICGNNGSGKTTLLKVIMGEIEPSAGEIFRTGFNYVYLDQQYSIIDRRLTVFEQVQKFNGRNLEEHELKSLLHYAQFPQERWDRKCAALSGGEQMKLSFCCLSVSNHAPDVLILDEPTNNLDLQSLEVLTAMVAAFAGTLLVISHDRYFVEAVGAEKEIQLFSVTAS